ncbi:MAG: DUF3179 domain-containing protein [Pseudaminobacter sp.]|nr:DUF3179 domain-containing protein [Pseudaminobacter sp.]
MQSLIRALMLIAAIAVSAGTAIADPENWIREGWKTDFSKSSVPFDEMISGGPPRDGIPSIDAPKFASASEVDDIADREPVIQFGLDGDTRAYPLRVLMWHEIANDIVGGTPVAVTYCPLCNAAIVFDRRINGRVLEFGTTGKLRNSDLVMYDRQTESWWQQFTGEAIVGDLTGERLKLLPSRIMSFGAFRTANPQGQILVPNDPGFRDYGRNPYASYDTASVPFLYRGDLPENVPAMARVVVVRTDGDPIIVSLDKVRADGFERNGYRITFEEGVASALDDSTIAEGRDVGTVRVTKDGKDVVHDITFAFVAHAFHPRVAIVQ